MKLRLLELDALRGIAAFMVLIYHYTTRYGEVMGYDNPPSLDLPIGHYGVHLFFVISGFVIFLTLNACRRPADFVVSRFARLYPIYWVAVTITFCATHLFDFQFRKLSVQEYLVNLTMVQKFLDVKHVDPVYWTLQWELIFYGWMFLIFCTKKLNEIEKLIYLFIAFQWIGYGVLHQIEWQIPAKLNILLLLAFGHLFAAGIIFYRWKERRILSWSGKTLLGCCLVSQFFFHGTEGMFAMLVVYVLMGLFVMEKLTVITWKPLVFLGTISYSLYLIHEYIGWIMIRDLTAMGYSGNVSVVLTTLSMLLLASALTFWIERPTTQIIKKFCRERFGKSSEAQ